MLPAIYPLSRISELSALFYNRDVELKVAIVMGVAGSGKTTVGELLARRLGWKFADADQFHSAANKQKMADGIPLDDADRAPWLRSMRMAIAKWQAENEPHVLACSALRSSYRELLKGGDDDVVFVYLAISQDEALKRLKARQNHFMKSNMIESQFATLEEPRLGEAIRISASDLDAETIVSKVAEELANR